MNFAIDKNTGLRITPQRGATALCQYCKGELIARCGEIKIHHWAHKSITTCDKWWETETKWHKEWKNRFPTPWQEKLIVNNETKEKHIADIYNPNKELIIEFQNSPISKNEMISRERFYNKMVWVISSKQMNIEISSLQTLLDDIKNKADLFYSEYINPHIKIPQNTKNELSRIINSYLGLKNAGQQEIIKFISIYNKKIDYLCSGTSDICNKQETYDPNKTKKMLLQPLITKIINSVIAKISYPTKFYRYTRTRGSKTWDYVSKPLFLDTEDSLFLLQKNEIARKVSKNTFLTHYGGIL